MGIVSVGEKKTGRRRVQGNDWKRAYSRAFTVVTSDPQTGAIAVAAAVDPGTGLRVPGVGNFYAVGDMNTPTTILEQDRGSFVQSVECEVVAEDGCQWEVKVEYGPYDASVFPQNPLDHPIKISWGYAKFKTPIFTDVDEEPLVNSAGDFFSDPGPEIDDSRPILKIVRNEAKFDPSIAYQFKDFVNKDPFFGGDPKTWKCADISADLEYNQDSGTKDGFYYVVTYEFEYDPETWSLKLLDQGMRTRETNGDKNQIRDKKGELITDPELLDGDGQVLAVGADPYFFEYDVYPEATFADLKLDPDGAPGQDN